MSASDIIKDFRHIDPQMPWLAFSTLVMLYSIILCIVMLALACATAYGTLGCNGTVGSTLNCSDTTMHKTRKAVMAVTSVSAILIWTFTVVSIDRLFKGTFFNGIARAQRSFYLKSKHVWAFHALSLIGLIPGFVYGFDNQEYVYDANDVAAAEAQILLANQGLIEATTSANYKLMQQYLHDLETAVYSVGTKQRGKYIDELAFIPLIIGIILYMYFIYCNWVRTVLAVGEATL